MKPKVNPQIRASIASRNIQNIKLAFELAEAANCPYLKAFKKKYFGRKVKSTKLNLRNKLHSLLLLLIGANIDEDFFEMNPIFHTLELDYCLSSTNHLSISQFKGPLTNGINRRITAGKTSAQWAVIQHKKALKDTLMYHKDISDSEEIPF